VAFKLTTRRGSKVERERHQRLDDALDALERRGREIEQSPDATPVGGGLVRRFEPVQRVVARLELRGPRGLRVGMDVRGDGSSEGFSGRLRRRVIERRGGESVYDALRRTVRSR
jgi:hypothetical protein